MKRFFVLTAVFMFSICLYAAEENADTQACNYARKANDVKVWKAYLKKFPKGTCVFIAETELERNGIAVNEKEKPAIIKSKKISCLKGCEDSETGYMWSALPRGEMTYREAKDYCSHLNESGYSDWILPATNQLSTIAKKLEGDSGLFWTTTQGIFEDHEVVCIDLGSGWEYSQCEVSKPHSVRCVRW